MALVNTVERKAFDTTLVKKGDLIYVEYENWIEPKRGFVIFVSEEKITMLYPPGIANVTNRLELSPANVAKGGYTVRWTSDMETINEFTSVEPEPDPEEVENDDP